MNLVARFGPLDVTSTSPRPTLLDEHVIAALMGHLTAEMRARYRHLFPSQRRAAVASVFG